ncbi:MAG: carboxypeptidase regulatory-like domain-containing protein [Patescibacteria group bacterium]
MRKATLFLAVLCLLVVFPLLLVMNSTETVYRQWEVQAIDTMKYSRDTSRAFMDNPNAEKIIDDHVASISAVGATHIAIATPYDPEFIPVLTQWVQSARRHNLKIWFRGNFSGWEQWFGYAPIDRTTHVRMTREFILANPDLFEDGDLFSACPECENGGQKVNYWHTSEAESYRVFLIDSYQAAKESFAQIGKNVPANYYSMNYDVANAVMDTATTQALDGLVTIDHYVSTPERLNNDIRAIAEKSGGRVFLGEFGAPIPDIHGEMTQEQQAAWIREALERVSQNPNLEGLSYWVDRGGSTAIWEEDGREKQAVSVLRDFYQSNVVKGVVKDAEQKPIAGAEITSGSYLVVTDENGAFAFPYLPIGQEVVAQKSGYTTVSTPIDSPYTPLTFELGKQKNAFQVLLDEFFTIFISK